MNTNAIKLNGVEVTLRFPAHKNDPGIAAFPAGEIWIGTLQLTEANVQAVFCNRNNGTDVIVSLSPDDIESALRSLSLGEDISLRSNCSPSELPHRQSGNQQ